MAEICFQKAPGQDLAQKGRFPRIPEEKFNSRPRGRQMPEICFQKAPGQDLAQKGRFPMILKGDFNSRRKGRQMPEICFQKVPGQDLARPIVGEILGRPQGLPRKAGRAVPSCLEPSKTLQGGRSQFQSKCSKSDASNQKPFLEKFQFNLALLNFDMPFWQAGTFEKFNLNWFENIRMHWKLYEHWKIYE